MAPKKWSIGVFGIMTDGNGRILVSKRADGQGWDLPGGGVDSKKDGDFIDTLRREIFEETECIAYANAHVVGVYPDFFKKDVMILYFVPGFEGEPKPTEESVEHRFVDKEILKREIRLVGQEYPGHEQGRFWHMVKDSFMFLAGRERTDGTSR